MDYREAGVDVEAGRAFVERIRNLVHSTHRSEVIGRLGGFSGCFQHRGGSGNRFWFRHDGYEAETAQTLNCHHTVGIDLVMCE